MSEKEAFEFVLKTLQQERISPFHNDELDVIRSIENCINCGLCLNYCPVVKAIGLERFAGPRSIAMALSRSSPEFWTSKDVIYLCTGCGTCMEVCPKNVNIPEIVNIVRARIYKIFPELIPSKLRQARNIIAEFHLAFEPWEDLDDKAESRKQRLERFGLPQIEDIFSVNADVLFYPGCQAEERTLEVRESAKAILSFFNVNYTLLKEMSCCGLPARLIGDDELARNLAAQLKSRIKELNVKCIVTTCAGCTSNLNELAERDNWGIPVYHIIEYIVEIIGLERLLQNVHSLKNNTNHPQRVTIHEPCHLIRHVSRRIMEYATTIVTRLPNVEFVSSTVADSCCGGGGMIGYHSPKVASAVTQENVAGIVLSGAERVVTPCPLCTSQLETELFKSGSKCEVEDLSVFVARHLHKGEGE